MSVNFPDLQLTGTIRPADPTVAQGIIEHGRDDNSWPASPNRSDYISKSALDAALTTAGYSSDDLAIMTTNDKVFALRQEQNLVNK